MNDATGFDFRQYHAEHKIAMIVACSENRVIGAQGDLPWHLPGDLKHFMRSTRGCSVIMGRKTFETLDKPLPNRLNIILSRTMSDDRTDGVRVAQSLDVAIEIAESSGLEMPIWIAGGGHIYRMALEQTDLVVRTLVHAQVEGDTEFPLLDSDVWEIDRSVHCDADEKHPHSFTIEWWTRQS
ncbi:MAG: dihydrofolate reductase [Phycisphaerales bacterium]|nr:dihydrofolate reductase [Phycisphaerales bacterium]